MKLTFTICTEKRILARSISIVSNGNIYFYSCFLQLNTFLLEYCHLLKTFRCHIIWMNQSRLELVQYIDLEKLKQEANKKMLCDTMSDFVLHATVDSCYHGVQSIFKAQMKVQPTKQPFFSNLQVLLTYRMSK